MAFSIRQWWSDRQRDRFDPVVKPPLVEDLRPLVAERGWEYREILPEAIQVCNGARALSEDFLQWVDRGPELLAQQRDTRWGKKLGRRWAAYLHSVRRYPVARVFSCVVPGATVIAPSGGVLTKEGERLLEGYGDWRSLRSAELAAPRRTLEGRFLSLLTMYGQGNFGHFFFDAMLRLAASDDLEGLRFLVPSPLQPWHRGLLEIAGIAVDRVVVADAPFTQVDELLLCYTSREGALPRKELLVRFRERVWKNVGVNPSSNPRRRIFVDRSRAKARKLANQHEVEALLRDRGFEIVIWEDYSMAEQVRLAAEAEIMAGPHGSSLLNSVYCQPGAKVLEILNPEWWDAATLRQNSLLGHEFWYCLGENCSKEHDTRVDPAKLARVLDYMLDAPVTDLPPY